MPIIKPLQLEPTSDIEEFAATVFQPNTLSIIYGPERVGKTALLYKLLLHRFRTEENMKGIFLGLDKYDSYQYHQKRLAEVMAVSSIREKFTSMDLYKFTDPNTFFGFISVLPHITLDIESQFIFVDGLNILPDGTFQNKVIIELKFLANCGIPVLASTITKPNLCNLIDYPSVKNQTFQLERPEFLGGEILEFGDSLLIKKE